MAPEGARDSANEWLSLVLYDIIWVSRISLDSADSSQHTLHWASLIILTYSELNSVLALFNRLASTIVIFSFLLSFIQ